MILICFHNIFLNCNCQLTHVLKRGYIGLGSFCLDHSIPIGSMNGVFNIYLYLIDFYGKCR